MDTVSVAEYRRLLAEEAEASKNIAYVYKKLQNEKAPDQIINQVLMPFVEHYKEIALTIRDLVIQFEPLANTENE